MGVDLYHDCFRYFHTLDVFAVQTFHVGMPALPRHGTGPLHGHPQVRQESPIPMILQYPPHALDRVVLAMVRRVVHEVNLKLCSLSERHQSLQKQLAVARVDGAVVQADHQSPNPPARILRLLPPELQTVHPKVARLITGAEQNHHYSRGDVQDSERHPFFSARPPFCSTGGGSWSQAAGTLPSLSLRVLPSRLYSPKGIVALVSIESSSVSPSFTASW